MDKIKRVATVFIMAGTSLYATAQNAVPPVDVMHSNGKIYVVMTVVTIIITGLLLYVMRVDRKIGKLEKKL